MIKKIQTMRWIRLLTLSLLLGSFSMVTGCAALKNLAQNGQLADLLGKVGVDLNKITGGSAQTEIGGVVVEYNDLTGESSGVPYAEVSVAVGSTVVTDWADEDGNFRVPVGDISLANTITVTAKLSGQYQSNTATLRLGTDYSPGYEYVSAGSIVLQPIVGSTTSGRISGSIFYGPLPLSGVTVTALSSGGTSKSAKTNASGFYVLTGLSADTYTMSASLSDFTTKTAPGSVEVALNQTVTGNDFVLEPNSSVASKYDISNLGIIKAQMVGQNDTSGGPLPGFILSASATLLTAQTNDGQEIKAFIDPKNSTFVFRGVPIGKHKVKVSIKMDPQKFLQDQNNQVQARQSSQFSGIQELSYTYEATSVALPKSGSLDQITFQKITVKESDFGFDQFFNKLNQAFNTNINLNVNIGGPQNGPGQGQGHLWIEQEVRMRVGTQDSPMTSGVVELIPESGSAITSFIQNGRFGTGLPKSGRYTLKIYKADSDGHKQGEALVSKTVTIPDRLFDPRGWHIGPIFVTGDANSILKDLGAVPIKGTLWVESFNGPVDSSITDGLQVVMVSDSVPSYSVTLNVTKQDNTNFSFTADIKPLGQFKARVVAGGVTIRDPFQSYFIDQFNSGAQNFGIALRSNAVSARVVAVFGNQNYGVAGAKVQLLKNNVAYGSPVTTKTGFTALDQVFGAFSLTMPVDPTIATDGSVWKLQISDHGNIVTKNIGIQFRNDNGVLVSDIAQLNSDIKVTPVRYFGATFEHLSGRLASNTPSKIANVPIVLQYIGLTSTYSATTDAQGNFTFEQVPAFDGQFRITVKNGSDIGQTDLFFLDHNLVQGAITGVNPDAQLPFHMFVNFSGFAITTPISVGFRYNNNIYYLNGATLNIQSLTNAATSINAASDDFGNVPQVYIPSEGQYAIKVLKGTVVAGVATINFNQNQPNGGWNNTNIVIAPTDAQILQLAQQVTVKGYVKTSSGTAVSGAQVAFKASSGTLTVSANTGSDGAYSIQVPKVGAFQISAKKSGFQTAVADISLEPFNTLTDSVSVQDLYMNPSGSGDNWQLSDVKLIRTVTKTVGSNLTSTGTTSTVLKAQVKVSKNGTLLSGGSAKVVVMDSNLRNAQEMTAIGDGVYECTVSSLTSSGTQIVFGIKEGDAVVYPNPSQYAASLATFANVIRVVPNPLVVPTVTSIAKSSVIGIASGPVYTVHAENNGNYFGFDGTATHKMEVTLPNGKTFVARGALSASNPNDVEIVLDSNQSYPLLADGTFANLGTLIAELSDSIKQNRDSVRLITMNPDGTSFAILIFETDKRN